MRRRFFSNRFDYMILYTSTDENIVTPKSFAGFNQNIKSNTYNHIGKITFWGPFSIGREVFYDCDNLKTIIIPNGVTSIGYYAFAYCDNLTSVTIPNSVTSIGDNAFYGCSGLTNIQIPNSVTNIGLYAFYSCYNLTSIEIPNSVTSIGDWAFADCSSLTNIQIPNSVTSIGGGAFNDCTGLIGIKIPNSVTSIGGGTFRNCSRLTSIEIPNSITSIGGEAFRNCLSLTSIEIPNSVTSIRDSAFMHCSRLSSVYVKPTTPPTLGNYVFDSNASDRKIYVPRASLNAYKTASNWSKYANSIEPYDFDGSVNEITFYIDDGAYVIPMKAMYNMTWGEFVNSEYAEQNSMFTNFRLFSMGSYNGIKFYHEEAMYDMPLYDDQLHSQNTADSDIIEDGKTYYAY